MLLDSDPGVRAHRRTEVTGQGILQKLLIIRKKNTQKMKVDKLREICPYESHRIGMESESCSCTGI